MKNSQSDVPFYHLLSFSCESLFDDAGEQYCEWDRNGMGIEYQILAGPSFIAVYTIGGVILGIAADKYKRSVITIISRYDFSTYKIWNAAL